jgi:hypothetical protein
MTRYLAYLGPHVRDSLVWRLAAVLVVPDLLLAPMLAEESLLWVAVATGLVCGQVALCSLWGVLGTGPVTHRWLIILLVPTAVYCLMAAGDLLMQMTRGWFLFELGVVVCSLLGGLMILPLAVLVAQLPLWIVRTLTGWRIIGGGQYDPCVWTPRQFSLRQVLALTTGSAVALGLASEGLHLIGVSGKVYTSTWAVVIGIPLLYGAGSLLWTIPCLWAVFLAPSKGVAMMVLICCESAKSIVMLSVFVLAGGSSVRAPDFVEAVIAAILFQGTLVGLLLGGLYVLRRSEYVLLRTRRSRSPWQPAADPATDAADDTAGEPAG